MIHEKSCGAVVFTRVDGQPRYLLVSNLEGIWGFPKGHVEPGETETETALREIREETGLTVMLLPGFRAEDAHAIPQRPDTVKRVVYFLGEYREQTFRHQREELSDARLADYEAAMAMLQFDSSRRILTEAHRFLVNR